MKLSRAAFLNACGMTLLGSGVDTRAFAGLSTVASNPEDMHRTSSRFRPQDATALLFRPHLNSAFVIRSAEGVRARVVLAKVVERPVTKNIEQFSLIFHAPAGVAVPDGTYVFQHAALGELDVFIVPIGGSNERRTVYEACFSRRVNPAPSIDSGAAPTE